MLSYNQKEPRSQTGSTQKINLVLLMACAFIALVVLLAWIAVGRIQVKIQSDTGEALQTVLVPPLLSDVSANKLPGNRQWMIPTMFFAAPVKNSQGQTIAVVTQRIDPEKDFTRLIQLGRIGKSGETYAFGKYGKLLSESRFDKDLRKIGLIRGGQKGILTISIRDPGGNLVKGFKPKVPRYQQPLTVMAAQATEGQPGVDVEGYRDYRGVPVYGAWLWDGNLGLGLATEIDEADALRSYYTARNVITTVMAITVLLALGSLLFAVLIDERASRALQKSHDELEHRVQERTAELRKLSEATEHSPASVVITDKDGTIEYVNATFREVTGYTAEEAIGQNPRVLKSGDLPAAYYKALWDTILGGNVWEGDLINRKKNGEEFWESASISPIKNDQGQITHFVAVKQDITERKLQEQRFQQLINAAPDAMVIVTEEGQITLVNNQTESMFGYHREELLGEMVEILVPQEIRSEHPEFRKRFLADPQVITPDQEIDFVAQTKDGLRIPVDISLSQIETAEGMLVVAALRDITERKQMEAELIQAKHATVSILFPG